MGMKGSKTAFVFANTVVNPEQGQVGADDVEVVIVGSRTSPRKRRARSASDSGEPSLTIC